jgi:hypothetical protein
MTQSPSQIKSTEYERILAEHKIDRLKPGSDLMVLSHGDLRGTVRGGIQLGDSHFSALFDFVNGWIGNLPTLRLLFGEVSGSVQRKAEFTQRMNQAAQEVAEQMLRGEMPTHNSFVASEEGGQIEVGRDACAGALFVILNVLLQGIRTELKCESIWKFTATLNHGYSIGQVIEAASNNFRHYDEWTMDWVANKAFTSQQMRSVKVLAKALDETEFRMLSGNVCGRLLLSLSSNGNFNDFEGMIMKFAQDLVDASEANSTVKP